MGEDNLHRLSRFRSRLGSAVAWLAARLVQMNRVARFSAADHHLDIRRRRFQIKLQLRHLGGEIIEGNQRENGDAQSAGRGNQRLADAAGDGGDGQFRAADVEKRAHQAGDRAEQAEQRRERDERVHDGEKTSGAFEFDARRQLQRAEQRAVRVTDVVEAVMNHADDRVFRAFGNFLRGGDVGIFQRGEQLLQFLRVALAAFAPPPERAFADDGDGDEGADENRPHDRAAFEEEFENDVCEHGIHG